MKLLLDTSILIDHLREDPRAIGVLMTAVERADELWASVITRSEIRRGMRSAERAQTEILLETISWIDVSLGIADRAGELARAFRRSHPGIDLADFLIAASAEELRAIFVTRNVRHFPMFPDLQAPYL